MISEKDDNQQHEEENFVQQENSNIENLQKSDIQDEQNTNENPNENETENSVYEVFIKNIPYATTDEDLHSFLTKYAKIVKVNILKINGRSKGYGYVQLEDKEEKQKLLFLQTEDLILEGRKLEILEPNHRLKNNKDSDKTLFVKNIPYTANEEDLMKFFDDCKNIKVRIFYENGRSRGFAQVDFENEEDIEKALKKNNENLGGRTIKVEKNLQNSISDRRYGFNNQIRGRINRPTFRGYERRERRDDFYHDVRDRNWERDRERERGRDRMRMNDFERDWRRDDRSRERNWENERNRDWERRERERYRRDRRESSSRSNRDRSRDRRSSSDRSSRDRRRDNSRNYERERRHSHYHNGYRE